MVVPFVIEFFTYAFSEIKVFGSVCAGVRVVRIGFFGPGYCDGGLRGFAPVEAECIDAFLLLYVSSEEVANHSLAAYSSLGIMAIFPSAISV